MDITHLDPNHPGRIEPLSHKVSRNFRRQQKHRPCLGVSYRQHFARKRGRNLNSAADMKIGCVY